MTVSKEVYRKPYLTNLTLPTLPYQPYLTNLIQAFPAATCKGDKWKNSASLFSKEITRKWATAFDAKKKNLLLSYPHYCTKYLGQNKTIKRSIKLCYSADDLRKQLCMKNTEEPPVVIIISYLSYDDTVGLMVVKATVRGSRTTWAR